MQEEPGMMALVEPYVGTLLALALASPPYMHASLSKLSKGALPAGKRLKAALAICPLAIVMEIDLSLVFALVLAMNIALLRRKLCPELLSRKQIARVLTDPKNSPPKCMWVPKMYGDLEPAPMAPPVELEQLERVVLRSPSPPMAELAFETALDHLGNLIEQHLGPQFAKCFPGRCCRQGHAHTSYRHRPPRQSTPSPSEKTRPPMVGVAPTAMPDLTPDEQRSLEGGQTVLKRNSAGGLSAQRVRAPAHVVWATLNDFEAWPRMVDHCVGTKVYATSLSSDGATGSIKCAVTLGAGFVRITAHVHHTIDRDTGRSAWTLDETQANDCHQNDGYWLVRPDPADENASYIYYTTSVRLAAWVPSFINSFIGDVGLPKAVGWLQRESEKRYKA